MNYTSAGKVSFGFCELSKEEISSELIDLVEESKKKPLSEFINI